MLMLNIVVKFADCCGNLFMLSVCVFDDYLLVFLVANCWSGHISVPCLYSYGKLGAIAVILIYGRVLFGNGSLN